jgi:Family of unknown function (DUF5684)
MGLVEVALLGYLLYVAPWCGVFAKADKRWWVALVPVLNVLVLLRVAGRPLWWFLLLLVPLVGIAVWVVVCLDIAEAFGHGLGFTIGLVFLPFVFAVLIWLGPSTYTGPVAVPDYRMEPGE